MTQSPGTNPSVGASAGKPRIAFWALQAGIALLWLLVWHLAALLEYAPHASLWYPPAAVSYAAFRLYAWRGIPAVFLANVTATWLTNEAMGGGLAGSDLIVGCLLVFLAHATPYYLAARLMDE
ncbi:MAG: hypothetical protein R3200_15600, partial [Xanthomonadales bacterium]|nr:hypothetical protein [Xanthomonadales bacterium]